MGLLDRFVSQEVGAFDLLDLETTKNACHRGNLQPLWWEHNESKSDKMPGEWSIPFPPHPDQLAAEPQR